MGKLWYIISKGFLKKKHSVGKCTRYFLLHPHLEIHSEPNIFEYYKL